MIHRGRFIGVVSTVLITGCVSTPPEQDPVQIKLNDLDTRLARIERVVANHSLLEMANEVESLRGETRSLRNESDQSLNRYAELDTRVKRVELNVAGSPVADSHISANVPSVPDRAAGTVVAGGDDRAEYQAAFALLKDSQYDRAIAAFQKFLLSYPQSTLADNASYWLGEALYVKRSFSDALVAFQSVIEKYPKSRKIPDAMLKIGYCHYELKQWDAAKLVLTQVAAKFSDTPAGRLAHERLEKMAAEKP